MSLPHFNPKSPDQYAIARDAVDWMDALAELVDQPTASAAADCAEAQCRAMQAAAEDSSLTHQQPKELSHD